MRKVELALSELSGRSSHAIPRAASGSSNFTISLRNGQVNGAACLGDSGTGNFRAGRDPMKLGTSRSLNPHLCVHSPRLAALSPNLCGDQEGKSWRTRQDSNL